MNNTIIKKSKRKTIQIEINENLDIIVRAPNRMSRSAIQRFINEHSDWIDKHMELMSKKLSEGENVRKLSLIEFNELVNSARIVIPARVRYYAELIGVDYGRVTVRNQKTRWGSCSTKGNLNFNVALMRAPIEVLDYVVVHELCHRIEMNHSGRFWSEVERVMPDYRVHRKWLKDNGGKLLMEINFD
ncbi:MAG: M48 family metallopeptidase [Lachnospiraceae bacterium]|nr:M48 family metallopeptidase [Lachnospiraceae bacterium]